MSLIVISNRLSNRKTIDRGPCGVDNDQVLLRACETVGKEWAQTRILSEKRSK